MDKKYELVKEDSIEWRGRILYRIRALKSINDIRKGEIGGYVESESNLSQEGSCWLNDDSKAYDNACVSDHAQVYHNAQVYENAQVYGLAMVGNNARIYGNAKVFEVACVLRNAHVYDNAMVYGNKPVYGEVKNDEVMSENLIIEY